MRPMKFGGEQLVFGEGSLKHLENLKGKKAVIVTNGDFFVKIGVVKKIVDYLKEASIESLVFTEVAPEPPFEDILNGAIFLQENTPDIIIGLGGGSALDAAKAMWVLYEHPELNTLEKFAKCHNNIPKLRNKAIMVSIPTTSGTASEVSRSVVITDKITHKKVGVSDMQLVPDVAILDPELTLTLPQKITMETGLDALTHAVEAYLSNRANIVSDVFALKAIKLLGENLTIVYNDGTNFEGRNQMQIGSYLAGLAFNNVSLGITHSIAHAIGGEFGIAHGLLNAIALPKVLMFYSKYPQVLDKLNEVYGDKQNFNYCNYLVELTKKLGIPQYLSEILIDKEKFLSILDQLTETALSDGCTKTSPIIPTREQMRQIILDVYCDGGEECL